MPSFGSAGNPDQFYDEGNKESVKMPEWLKNKGLDAYEYQCGKGVNIGQVTAKKLGDEASKNNIRMSIHAPYYVSPSSPEAVKRDNTVEYILQSCRIGKIMGADRIVVHNSGISKFTREEAVEVTKGTLKRALDAMAQEGIFDVHLCPETMGKVNVLGTIEEVCEICKIDDTLIPTVDFGHLNARSGGELKDISAVTRIFDTIENILGIDRLRVFHSHFSHIEYTKGGEKKHLTFEDTVFGPDFMPIAEIVYKKGLHPVFICESAGTQAIDALRMKSMYESVSGKGE